MKKSLAIVITSFIFTLVFSAMAFAAEYNPGQRTIRLLGDTLNSDKHPVHLVVQQKIDMAEVLTPEAYAKLAPAQKVRHIRTEYNEARGVNAEHNIVTDGEGKVIANTNTFVKGGYWYTIDYVNKTYDRLPELPGMSVAFAETLVNWFGQKPEAGNDVVTGYDYDKMTNGERVMFFYFGKGTDEWKGYEVNYLPRFDVVEVSSSVNEETAFALPPADFKQAANQTMRSYANRLMEKR